ncbi:MAG: argininosuccinate synthase [bacterium]|nr:argininosuccinate synthase [bacterium]
MKTPKVVLAYSGGLDTSVILKWLRKERGMDVVAYVADLGQEKELAGIRRKALRTGAGSVFVEDLREEFARDFVFTALKANAVYEGGYLMGTSIARPLIAKRQVEIARRTKARAVAHGATGKGNDQVRFELAYAALAPDLEVIAPWREWNLGSRAELIEYARRHRIPIPVTTGKPYSSDRNLMHISFEGGILEDPDRAPDEEMFVLSVSPEDAPDRPTQVDIDFRDGVPVAVNGRRLSPARLLARLNELGGRNGIGRADIVENRYVGIKCRGVYETPGGTILHAAHRAVESITMDREVMHLRDSLVPYFSSLVYNGYWFSPEMRVLRALIDESQRNVTGRVRLTLYKGNVIVRGRRSPVSLYSPAHATFEASRVYDQRDATGFIRLNGLRLKLEAMTRRR